MPHSFINVWIWELGAPFEYRRH